MDIERIINNNLVTINKYMKYTNVKIRGSVYYHNFVDEKWVFYISSCILSTKSGNYRFHNLKMLLLSKNYTVPEGYESIVGCNGDTPFILSPEMFRDSRYPLPESFCFGEFTCSDTRRKKYRIRVSKLLIIKKYEILNLSDVMLDLHYLNV